MLSSNAVSVVPAGKHARRWLLLDVAEQWSYWHDGNRVIGKPNDKNYFDPLRHEADNGGIEAMLHDLLRVDLTHFDSYQVPRTAALREQQLRSADSLTQWAFDRCEAGAFECVTDVTRCMTPAPHPDGADWPSGFDAEREGHVLYRDYRLWCDETRERAPEHSKWFGRWLGKLGYPGRRSNGKTYYKLPDAAAFARAVRRVAGIY